jgi:hypothetical protein
MLIIAHKLGEVGMMRFLARGIALHRLIIDRWQSQCYGFDYPLDLLRLEVYRQPASSTTTSCVVILLVDILPVTGDTQQLSEVELELLELLVGLCEDPGVGEHIRRVHELTRLAALLDLVLGETLLEALADEVLGLRGETVQDLSDQEETLARGLLVALDSMEEATGGAKVREGGKGFFRDNI